MSNEEFKKLVDGEKNLFDVCYKYYVAEATTKGFKVYSHSDFDQSFQIFLMMTNMGDISGGLNSILSNLKRKHEYV